MKMGRTLEDLKGDGGKYDKECEVAYLATKAKGVMLMVIGGDRGEGFSAILTSDIAPNVPQILRNMADAIESDMNQAKLQ